MAQNTSISARIASQTGISSAAIRIVAFAGLTALSAQVVIPHQPVPFTLQTFAVLLSGAMLGRGEGALSQLLYLACGSLGLPVYAGWGAGFSTLIGPTGGYLLAFPVAAYVIGWFNPSGSYFRLLLSMVVGLFIIFSLGTLQLYFLYYHDFSAAFSSGFLIFTWWDALKILAASGIARTLRPYMNRK